MSRELSKPQKKRRPILPILSSRRSVSLTQEFSWSWGRIFQVFLGVGLVILLLLFVIMEPNFWIILLLLVWVMVWTLQLALFNGKRVKRLSWMTGPAYKKAATALGLHYSWQAHGVPDPDRGPHYSIHKRYGHLEMVRQTGWAQTTGIRDVFTGTYQGQEILCFNFDSAFPVSAGIIRLAGEFPELRIWPRKDTLEGLSRIVDLPDIEMDNMKFSENFQVKSRSKKLCYHVLSPRMMELLLDHGKVWLELDKNSMFVCFDSWIVPEELAGYLDHLLEFRKAMPPYLFKRTIRKDNRSLEAEEFEDAPQSRVCSCCGNNYEFIEEYDDHYCWECKDYLSEVEEREP